MKKASQPSIQNLAAKRMIEGKKSHLDQTWSLLSREERDKELLEELADAYNYAENHPKESLIRQKLQGIYEIIQETSQKNKKTAP